MAIADNSVAEIVVHATEGGLLKEVLKSREQRRETTLGI
jgi:hypothetical protein